MSRECAADKNRVKCNCSNEECPRNGICCKCLVHHWDKGELPVCFFPAGAERDCNRSIADFIRCYQ
ncbi:DUF6485 family protein [Chloroflexota bacterium]